jgi:hypothetical protein
VATELGGVAAGARVRVAEVGGEPFELAGPLVFIQRVLCVFTVDGTLIQSMVTSSDDTIKHFL